MGYILWYKNKKILQKFNPSSMIVYSPSIFFGYLCKKVQKTFKVKSLCILRDLFPYWAIDVGYIKNFLVKKLLIKIFIKFISCFDSVGLESKSNVKILRLKINLNYFYLPNWVNLKNFKKINLQTKKN